MRGFRAPRARRAPIGNTPPEKSCENRLSSGGGEVLPVQPVLTGVTAQRELAFARSSGRLLAAGPRQPQGIVVAVDALGQVAGGHVLVALGGFGVAVAKLLLDEVERLALD
jgi:hypothetical protein